MKKRKIILFTVTALAILFSISYAEDNTAGQPQIKKPAVKVKETAASETILGRVIFVNNDSVEIKKGRMEITLIIAEGTVFVNTAGEEKNGDIIKLCQNVKASYTKEGDKKILRKITVIKESNCVK
jgi:hypothetical protein